MNKEIKFRGKRLDNGEWMYGDLNHLVDGVYISNDNGCNMAQVDPDTVGQYTGCKDKSGKEVYEGDVVEVASFLYVISWSETYGAFRLREDCPNGGTTYSLGADLCCYAVVKGNIHDKQKGGQYARRKDNI